MSNMVKEYSDTVDMLALLESLAPLKRTLACRDTDRALEIVSQHVPNSKVEGYPTGSKAWTWTLPKRWELERATISADGEVIVDSNDHHLHVLNYSVPFKGTVSRDELLRHIHTSEVRREAIPFKFSFYESKWGFCIPHSWLPRFSHSEYDVDISASHEDGDLNVLYSLKRGRSDATFIICSNICHPTQVNDSLTGLAVSIDIFRRLCMRDTKYSYLLLVVPETVGSIAYLANNEDRLPNYVGAMFSEMLATEGQMVFTNTRRKETYWDMLLHTVVESNKTDCRMVPFLQSAANDEKVLDSPGVNIPTITLSRAPYEEYHTSDDNFGIVNIEKLREARDYLQAIIDTAERDFIPVLKKPGPVFLSGYGLYPDWYNDKSLKQRWDSFIDIMYALDGDKSVVEIANATNQNIENVSYWCERFYEKGLLDKMDHVVRKS